jgi:multidrug efflux pump subunit AcrA (membrane-fusion protein)
MLRRLTRPRVLVPLLVLAAVAGGAGLLYIRQAGAATPQYRFASATVGTVTQTVPISGNLAPVDDSLVDFTVSGRVTAVDVSVGQNVTAGQTLATIDSSNLQAALTQAQAALASAQAKLAQDQAGPTATSLAQSQAQVNSATQQLAAAKTSLRDTQNLNAEAVSQAQAEVTSTQATAQSDQQTVAADQNQLNADNCSSNSSTTACQQDQQKYNTDYATWQKDLGAYNSAVTNLSSTQAKATQSDDQAQAQVNSAQVQLTNAQNALAALQQPVSGTQLQIDQSQVTVDQVNVQTAQSNLNAATLTAPAAGVVSQVNLTVGQAVSGAGASSSSSSGSATHQIEILTPGLFAVTGSVGDAQINQIAVGQRASVTPAGSTEAITGKVTAVGLVATISSGVATFPVTVTLDGNNPALHSGESASVRIIVNQVVGVLTVPSSAVHNLGGNSIVNVLAGGVLTPRPVQIGASDAQRTQILSGLSDGDQIIIATITRTVPTTGNNGGGFFLGGGGGGRGGGGGGRFGGGG